MKLLVVSATELEIEPFLRSKSCDVLITGVGIHSVIFHLTRELLENKFDMVIQAGIAGSFSEDLKPGKVVIIERDAFGDIGVEENGKFKTTFEMGFGDANEFPFNEGWLKNNSDILNSSGLEKVTAITLSKISDSEKQKQQLIEKFQPGIESMEGAAFHYVCLQQKIPFIQLRSISNYVGERDKSKWRIGDAVINLNEELIKITDAIKEK